MGQTEGKRPLPGEQAALLRLRSQPHQALHPGETVRMSGRSLETRSGVVLYGQSKRT